MALLENFFYSVLSLLFQKPTQIQIGITDKCNLSCKMCPRKLFVSGDQEMPIPLFRECLKKLSGARELTLTGWGEPLVHPHFFEMLGLCKEKGFKVKFTTNGILLDELNAKKIVSLGTDSVSFSVESVEDKKHFGHRNRNVFSNIKNLGKARKKNPKIILQTTLHSDNEPDILGLIKRSKRLGVDKLKISRLDIRHNPLLKRPSLANERKFFKKAKYAGKKESLAVAMANYPALSSIREILISLFLRLFNQEHFCIKTLNYLYVRPDGKVTPCCSLPSHVIGDLSKQDLKAIWRGKSIASFRKNQKEICNACDLLKKDYCRGK